MGRKPLGKAGRTITKTVKVTSHEQDYLTRKYGSVSAALRAGLEKILPESINHPTRAIRPGGVVDTQDTLLGGICGPRPTDHPGWKEIARGPKTGTIIKECRVCGTRLTEKMH